MKRHDYGDLIQLSVTFRDLNGTPTDPTTTALKIILPTGGTTTLTDPDLTHTAGSGYYRYNLAGTIEGTYTYRWEGAGAVTDAIERQLAVRATPFY